MSEIWKHFDQNKILKKAVCKVCKKDMVYVGGGTTSLWRHLKRHTVLQSNQPKLFQESTQDEVLRPVSPT